ncbi:MAG: glycerophosphodiester phosphodiesterase family protein [Planctomycetota bacterium]|nr:glycerophosphodiester phosphodiesterase family protein [Planctomycetota bacterium]
MSHPPHPPLPRWIGHRGAAERAPENTLASLRRAAADGAQWVEFDLRLTADGRPVLLHDATLERTTNGCGPLAAQRWADLRGLDAGSWFGHDFRGEAIPSLAQALECCAALGLGANLELKAEAGGEDALVAAVAEALEKCQVPVIVSAFEIEALECAARRMPKIARGLLCHGAPIDAGHRARALGCASVHVAEGALDLERSIALRADGASLLAYTVNDCARARALYEFGVAAVFTDDPARFAAAF